jgi:spore coat protein H
LALLLKRNYFHAMSFVRILPVLLLIGILSHAADHAPGMDLFTNGPVLRLKVTIKKDQMDSLRSDHRKPVPAALQEGSTSYNDVGVHLKGAAGSFRDVDDRPALTLDFDKFSEKQKFHGLSKIHLNNSVQDPALLDEAICGELFRAAGVPAARATHAFVDLNGRKLGLYVVKEGFTKEFLRQYFKNTDGNFYDAGFVKEITEGIPKLYGKGPDDRSDIDALIKAAEEPNEAKRWKKLNEILDVDRFISMSVLEVFTVHWDGYGFQRNNYKLYVNPENKKIIFFAHGMDQMFGRGGEEHLSLEPPMGGLVSQALYSTAEGRKRYFERAKVLFEQVFQIKDLLERVDKLAAPVQAALASKPAALRDYNAEIEALKERITTRQKVVANRVRKLPSP